MKWTIWEILGLSAIVVAIIVVQYRWGWLPACFVSIGGLAIFEWLRPKKPNV